MSYVSQLGKTQHSVEAATELLVNFFGRHRGGITFLTGAGFSTESGIPDYRGKNGVYTRNPNYKRYWARSFFGYLPMQKAQPNRGHIALAQLQRRGWFCPHGITQNVDGLHLAAGTTGVVELHGALRQVSCTQCADIVERDRMQLWLEELNPDWAAAQRHFSIAAHKPTDANFGETWKMTPDGDVEIAAILGEQHIRIEPKSAAEYAVASKHRQILSHTNFNYPSCFNCGGIYKPNVVFFGESIPRHVHNAVDEIINNSTALLVMGTSLAVGSAMRVLRKAKPREIAMINIGSTRGDSWADIRMEVSCVDTLYRLNTQLQ
ncbi:DHS-like NAD/FAD-binding domain-containing protein [Syncephalis fuscata]|nr:DHS-like NAD/FAD-binding domain-containing protein [Syncephalis fuscata]